MKKLKLVGIVTGVLGFHFSDVYASSSALLTQAEIIVNCGVDGLGEEWSPSTVQNFLDAAEQCRDQLQKSPLFEGDEQLILVEGELASLEETVRDLEELAMKPDEEKKRYLKSIAYRSDPRLQSLILSRLDQIEKGQSGEKQSEEGKSKMDSEDIPPVISAKSEANPKIVKGSVLKKSKKSNPENQR
ncbi:MAG: hypothetical protein LBR92_03920 [Puniceicoccales bacterium]|jgi:hypothetical protein|nr:hypothetical protein [Puniceicoccales bacterium]